MTYSAKKSPELLDYLLHRRSVSLKYMGDKRPNDDEIETILAAAARTPDHGKLCPWYFIIVKDEARHEMAEILKESYVKDEDSNASPAKLELESERFLRAPMAIIIVSRAREGKHPLWEQYLSAGAVCMNASLAAHALGYGVNWLSEWYSYSPTFREKIGLDDRDNIAGVMYIGDLQNQPEERERPALHHIVTNWENQSTPLNKGDAEYGAKSKSHPCALPPHKIIFPEGMI